MGTDVTHSINTGKSLLNYGFENHQAARLSGKILEPGPQFWRPPWSLQNIRKRTHYRSVPIPIATNYIVLQDNHRTNDLVCMQKAISVEFSYACGMKRNTIDSTESHQPCTHGRCAVIFSSTVPSAPASRWNQMSFKSVPGEPNKPAVEFISCWMVYCRARTISEPCTHLEFTKRLAKAIEVMGARYDGQAERIENRTPMAVASIRAIF